MDKKYHELMQLALTEKEIICYLLNKNDLTTRTIGTMLGVSHTLVAQWVAHVKNVLDNEQ